MYQQQKIHLSIQYSNHIFYVIYLLFLSNALIELGPEEDNVVRAFNQLATEYEEKYSLNYGGKWKQTK